ncbi:3-beta-hydroxysteroid-Delta(8),Delta(7)-isomerase-like [Protobothrops mucrosquamatus]|uniref:3-beta-hydroxysteroid-Delta(8), Delta(7)-isomerase-like n=1 Tax=Protobothrops mucrosquamatus TaxID=103944 RepID=UPI0007758C06|nr:3-beta-hydroxysteroid-Delta(8),Delta(7)-isomerase-like [Protobothrops mucrosquamatus]
MNGFPLISFSTNFSLYLPGKEYGKGDSRYMISDNFIICVETVTLCVLTPLSLWTAVAFLSRQSHRYVLQLVVSVGHIYGDVLYFYTEYRNGFRHSEMWHPTYFWFYFVFLNSLWIIIPSILTWDAWKHLSACQRITDANKVKRH